MLLSAGCLRFCRHRLLACRQQLQAGAVVVVLEGQRLLVALRQLQQRHLRVLWAKGGTGAADHSGAWWASEGWQMAWRAVAAAQLVGISTAVQCLL